jgi:hypothetical protein
MGCITFPYNFMFIIFKKFVLCKYFTNEKLYILNALLISLLQLKTYKKIILKNFPFFLYSYCRNHLQLLSSLFRLLLFAAILFSSYFTKRTLPNVPQIFFISETQYGVVKFLSLNRFRSFYYLHLKNNKLILTDSKHALIGQSRDSRVI